MSGQNPYQPPGANVGGQSRRGHPIKAVLAGTAADLGGSIFCAFLQAIVFTIVLNSRGLTGEEVTAHLSDSTLYFMASMVLGLGMDVLGGYVAARVANHNEYQWALVTAVCVAVLGQVVLGSGLAMSGYDLMATLAIFPLAILGAHLHVRSKAANIGPDDSNDDDNSFQA